MGRSFEEDPLTAALAPPPNETSADREAREIAESEAMRSEKKRKSVKLLLLGQSESGKTATLKSEFTHPLFQMLYCKRQWVEERSSWRCVVLLNLVRNINEILDILGREMAAAKPATLSAASSSNRIKFFSPDLPPLKFKDKHRLLRLRLAPLRRVQAHLEAHLGAAATELYTTNTTPAAPFDENEGGVAKRDKKEFSRADVRDLEDEVQDVIAGCREDMRAVWDDRIVREMMAPRKVRIEDSAGFFLNDVDRIARQDYQITDDDIIRARLRTVGVQEYRVTFENGHSAGSEWQMYDVGGTRSSRIVWYSYFDDCDAIIFLAPVSCFDEKLAEDRRVNRLEDRYMLWKSVCSCKLLAGTQLSSTNAKLVRGAKIRDSVPSFGDRRNDVATAARYFQQHFKEILRSNSPVQRPFYVHLTSVIDTKSTAVTLGAVEESILRDHLRRADLM
ncbi:guanine nucleotide binding protein, alpha subunit [Mycena pura]|uniref:Guanine nucleotide binding protein, alpha subunit n=1 Tax=Mycena pura TaxID=153505 RepID=A0AAD6VGY8_9AGAR|nr:guanine nucleotide binding protein, alpha subunit [Mycena pura]